MARAMCSHKESQATYSMFECFWHVLISFATTEVILFLKPTSLVPKYYRSTRPIEVGRFFCMIRDTRRCLGRDIGTS